MTTFKHADVKLKDETKIPIPVAIPKRPAKLNMQGREIPVKLNTFNVVSMPTQPVYQYDVSANPPLLYLLSSNRDLHHLCRSTSVLVLRSVVSS